jgi:hypothetical protein
MGPEPLVEPLNKRMAYRVPGDPVHIRKPSLFEMAFK